MAVRPQYSVFSWMKVLFYSFLLLFLFSCFLGKIQASEIHLSSASVNQVAATGFKNMASTLEVVHRHGPSAQTDKNQPVKLPSLAEILANDQLRVKSIQARAKPGSINKSRLDKKAKLPAGSGLPLDTLNYIVTIGLGTPERGLSLILDTGSELTWTQCQPCAEHCYKQKDPIFNPSTSTTYSNISCKSEYCPQGIFSCYHSVTCIYGVGYSDGSYTFGFLSKDKLTVTPTDVFRGFLFGCGQDNTESFGRTDGLLGLGRGSLSFVSQTAKTYGQYFSYCLPSTIHSSGFLAFGKNNKGTKKDNDAMIFTPFLPDPLFYFIEITAISVGGTRLKRNESVFTEAVAIIDTGTVITRLPPVAYNAMSKEFKKQMKKLKYKSAPTYEDFLDTCFHISLNTTKAKVPVVSFTFKGNAKIDLDASGILYAINSTYACLAFAGSSDPEDVAVFGSTQQMKFEVAYDVAGGKLGFVRNPNCQ